MSFIYSGVLPTEPKAGGSECTGIASVVLNEWDILVVAYDAHLVLFSSRRVLSKLQNPVHGFGEYSLDTKEFSVSERDML